MTNNTEIRVRYQETDQMGLVYHTNYFVWCEIGRTELLRSTGMSYKDIEGEGIYLPVVEVLCRYKIPARYDDVVSIETQVAKLTGVRIDFHYQLFRKSDGVLLAEAETHHAFVDAAGRPVNIKKRAPHLWERLQAFQS